MPQFFRSPALPLALTLALAGGCVAPVETVPTTRQRIVELQTGSLIARNAGGLVGKVKMAPSSLIANSGGTIIAANSSRFRTLAASALEAAAGAKVRVVSESGQVLYAGTKAGDDGAFSIRRIASSGPIVFVEATIEAGGHPLTLVSAVAAPRKGKLTADVTPATSLVAKKLSTMLGVGAIAITGVDARRLARAVEAVEAAMDDEALVAACVLTGKDSARYFDRWVDGKPELRAALKTILAGHALDALIKATPEKQAETPAPATTPAPSSEPPPPAPRADMGVFGVAGYGLAGYEDGPGGKARFNVPYDVATDADGNVYVADSENHAVRKIARDGTVSTLAGDGTAGFADGQGKAARFRELSGVAVGPDGSLYVADYGNHRIRKVAPDGTVTTFAGDGTPGLVDGGAARLNHPTDLTVDREGVVYVSDEGNHAVRKILPDGTVSTIAGDGTPGFSDGVATASRLNMPSDVALDFQGNLYVADTENHAVRKVTPAGEMSTLAGGGEAGFADGAGRNARFHTPYGIVVNDAGVVYIADSNNDAVRQISPEGEVTTFSGGPTAYRLSATEAPLFKLPSGLAIRRNAAGEGEVFVADAFNHRVTKFKIRIVNEEQMIPK